MSIIAPSLPYKEEELVMMRVTTVFIANITLWYKYIFDRLVIV